MYMTVKIIINQSRIKHRFFRVSGYLKPNLLFADIYYFVGEVVFISVLEAKASRARGHSGHVAPPNDPFSCIGTPPL